jgi:hypothetical protein
MSFTFFDSTSALQGDTLSLTRFCGPSTIDGETPKSRHCLQISFRNHSASASAWMENSHVSLSYREVQLLRDQLTRFLMGVTDGDSVGTFENPMTIREYHDMIRKVKKNRRLIT